MYSAARPLTSSVSCGSGSLLMLSIIICFPFLFVYMFLPTCFLGPVLSYSVPLSRLARR